MLETGIKQAFVYELSTSSQSLDDKGKVFLRTKPRMGEKYKWSKELQWYPHRDGVKRTFPPMSRKPRRAEFKKWKDEPLQGVKVRNHYLQFIEDPKMEATPTQKAKVRAFVSNIPTYAKHAPLSQMTEVTVAAGDGTGTHEKAIDASIAKAVQDKRSAI